MIIGIRENCYQQLDTLIRLHYKRRKCEVEKLYLQVSAAEHEFREERLFCFANLIIY